MTGNVFNGTRAVFAYNTLFRRSESGVPLEVNGGSGTADTHWSESVFGNELMTGFLNSGPNTISTVTIASLEDMGYGVSYAPATYTPIQTSSLVDGDDPNMYDGLILGVRFDGDEVIDDPLTWVRRRALEPRRRIPYV